MIAIHRWLEESGRDVVIVASLATQRTTITRSVSHAVDMGSIHQLLLTSDIFTGRNALHGFTTSAALVILAMLFFSSRSTRGITRFVMQAIRTAVCWSALTLLLLSTECLSQEAVSVLTVHNDNNWTGAGPVIPPEQNVKDLVVTGGKDGMLYVLRRSALDDGNSTTNSAIMQSLRITPEPKPLPQPPNYHGPLIYHGPNDWHHLHGTPVYWKGPQGPRLYPWPEMGKSKAFSFANSKLGQLEESKTSAAEGMPGASLALSANGSEPETGILWASRPLNAAANRRNVAGILEAYDARHIANVDPMWTSLQRDGGGFFAKFSPPTFADGRVFLPTLAPENPDRTSIPGKSAELIAYGLLPRATRPALVSESIDAGVVRFFSDKKANGFGRAFVRFTEKI